jgi:N-methylhydantoinase B
MTIPIGQRVDPITLEVLRNALPAVANEMSLDLQRSSYNMMIYEVGDYSCALLDAEGALIAQNMGGVSHFVSDLGVVIRDGLDRFGIDGFAPGDVILTNHQAVAGQHLNNVVVYTPIFHESRLRAFAAIRAHWVDIGGTSTGFGGSTLAFDPWGEGMQLDQVKAWEGGVADEKVLKLIRDNIRYPDSSMGDLRSQVAACHLAERRFVDLYDRYGPEVVDDAILTIFAQTEQKCRQAVAEMPDGVYEAESFLDGDPIEDGRPLDIRVKVTISGSDMEIDLSGCSEQRRVGVNGRTLAGALVGYKALTAPDDPVNEGSFAAARVVIPEGNVMMARFPAPMSGWSMILPTVVDTLFRALADAIPDRVAAGHFGILGIPLVFFGVDPETRRPFVSQSIEGGGWGGRPFEDGESTCVSICQGDVRNSPIENIELKVPLLVEERALLQDSGGAGTFRGGLGIRVRVRALAEGRWNLNQSRRRGLPPWGLRGGGPGSVPDNLIRRADETEFTSIDAAHVPTAAGAVVIQTSSGGGGWGPPYERDPGLVLTDVREGYVSVEAAERQYGVVLTPDGQRVDEQATRERRARHTRAGGEDR